MTMLDKIKRFFAPPAVGEDRDMIYAATLLNTILWIIFAVTLLGSGVMMILEPNEAFVNLLLGIVLTLALLGLRAALHRGYARVVGWLLTLLLWSTVVYLTMTSGGIHGMAATAFYLVIVAAGVLLGANATLIVGALCLLAVVVAFFLERVGVIAGVAGLAASAVDLITMGIVLGLVSLLLQANLRELRRWSRRNRQYEQTLIDHNHDLQISHEEQSVYTRAIERRLAYLEAATRVTWETAATPELTALWERLVTLISTEFSFYHVAIWLLDEPRRHLILQAASGAEGPRRLAREERLELTESPDLETVVWRAESRVCRAADREHALPTEMDFFASPELPEARTILWLPLRQVQASEVFGILALYSREADAFDPQDMLVLQVLADQSAVVINQARLRAELQESLQTAERVASRVTRESWQNWLRAESGRTYRYGDELAEPPMAAPPALPELLLPLRVRGQVLGQIVAHKAEGAWTTEENAMLETLMAQLEQALDSARLYEVTQRRALREQLTREITDHIRSSLTVEEAMRRAVQEVARVLRAKEAVGRIGAERTLLPTEEVSDHE